jgi:hypothetical protein
VRGCRNVHNRGESRPTHPSRTRFGIPTSSRKRGTGIRNDKSASIRQRPDGRYPSTMCGLARRPWLPEAVASGRNTAQAASRSTRTRQPGAVAMLTSGSSEKRETRPRSRSSIRGCVTPQGLAASACVQVVGRAVLAPDPSARPGSSPTSINSRWVFRRAPLPGTAPGLSPIPAAGQAVWAARRGDPRNRD